VYNVHIIQIENANLLGFCIS